VYGRSVSPRHGPGSVSPSLSFIVVMDTQRKNEPGTDGNGSTSSLKRLRARRVSILVPLEQKRKALKTRDFSRKETIILKRTIDGAGIRGFNKS
jgi:hypothetical protein